MIHRVECVAVVVHRDMLEMEEHASRDKLVTIARVSRKLFYQQSI